MFKSIVGIYKLSAQLQIISAPSLPSQTYALDVVFFNIPLEYILYHSATPGQGSASSVRDKLGERTHKHSSIKIFSYPSRKGSKVEDFAPLYGTSLRICTKGK